MTATRVYAIGGAWINDTASSTARGEVRATGVRVGLAPFVAGALQRKHREGRWRRKSHDRVLRELAARIWLPLTHLS
jgi:hypothetical protein